MDYVIIVNDNGELKTISATEFAQAYKHHLFEDPTTAMEAVFNTILDERSQRELEETGGDE